MNNFKEKNYIYLVEYMVLMGERLGVRMAIYMLLLLEVVIYFTFFKKNN